MLLLLSEGSQSCTLSMQGHVAYLLQFVLFSLLSCKQTEGKAINSFAVRWGKSFCVVTEISVTFAL